VQLIVNRLLRCAGAWAVLAALPPALPMAAAAAAMTPPGMEGDRSPPADVARRYEASCGGARYSLAIAPARFGPAGLSRITANGRALRPAARAAAAAAVPPRANLMDATVSACLGSRARVRLVFAEPDRFPVEMRASSFTVDRAGRVTDVEPLR
jgi:hypothetical protein